MLPLAVLGGGTAMALQLGHRKSYDLDFFVPKSVPKTLLHALGKKIGPAKPIIDSSDELTVVMRDTKISVVYDPFPPLHPIIKTNVAPLFDLRDLASNKAHAVGRRGVWRDYVDLFIFLKHNFPLAGIIKDAEKKFGDSFNAKLFLEQLTYFDDIEDVAIEWVEKKYTQSAIKAFLVKEVKRYLNPVQ